MMDFEDNILIIGLGLIVGLIFLYIYCWSIVSNAVNTARTHEELVEACKGLSIQNAPVRCLELGK